MNKEMRFFKDFNLIVPINNIEISINKELIDLDTKYNILLVNKYISKIWEVITYNYKVIEILELIIIILIGVAYITLAERKVMGAMQRRRGPNIVGIYGLLQPLADGIKLIIKEIIIPQQSNKIFFMLGPILTLTLALIIWIPIPFGFNSTIFDNNYGILYILAISTLSVYILLYSGWSSNSKYAFIGAIRSIAQLISYEVSMGIIVISILLLNNSFNLITILYNQIFVPNIFALLPIFILFFISALAETNRPPFDLAEAESELIAGYIVEYGGMSFAAIYLAEYAFIQSMSYLTSILFLGTTNPFFGTIFIIFGFIWVRATLPRTRYSDLMNLGWTKILPFSISYILLTFSLLLLLN
jgi:NADH:ubiquinone oxidoreductase subunit H